MGINKLSHEECCRLVEESIEHGLQTLAYIRKRLHKGYIREETVKSNCNFVKDVLCNINYYGAYLHGMVQMLLKLREYGLLEEKRAKGEIPHAKGDDLIYNKAIIDFLLADKKNCERFLGDDFDLLQFTDHEHDRKGKLVKCRAYFAKRVTTYQEDR